MIAIGALVVAFGVLGPVLLRCLQLLATDFQDHWWAVLLGAGAVWLLIIAAWRK
jgi:hypothetical protein